MKASLLEALVEARRSARPVVVATRLRDGAQALLDPALGEGREAVLVGDPGPWEMPPVREALRTDRASTVAAANGDAVFLRPHNPRVRVVVVGAAHVAQPLVEMVGLLGFTPIVVDPRLAFATPERFPDVEIVTSWPAEALAELRLDARTAVVALSHDPKLDDPALTAALASPAFYVGALGSSRTHAARVERLVEAGVDRDAVARIHAPVGFDIGARSPGEIALSVMAQIVAVLRGRGSG